MLENLLGRMLRSNNRARDAEKPQSNQQNLLKSAIGHSWQHWLGCALALFLLVPNTWAASCNPFPQVNNNYCVCQGSNVRVGWWYSYGTRGFNGASNTHLCTDSTDTVCASTVAGANAIGNVTAGQEMYFANKTVTPTEYFRCKYTGSNFQTTGHTHNATVPINSVGGLIFLAAGFLLVGAWVSRRKIQKHE